MKLSSRWLCVWWFVRCWDRPSLARPSCASEFDFICICIWTHISLLCIQESNKNNSLFMAEPSYLSRFVYRQHTSMNSCVCAEARTDRVSNENKNLFIRDLSKVARLTEDIPLSDHFQDILCTFFILWLFFFCSLHFTWNSCWFHRGSFQHNQRKNISTRESL